MKTSLTLHPFLSVALLTGLMPAPKADAYRVTSPDDGLVINIELDEGVAYTVLHDGDMVVAPSTADLFFAGASVLGERPAVAAAREISGDDWVEPVVPHRQARLHDHYRGLVLEFEGGHAVEFRAYNDGVAYRWITRAPGTADVTGERIDLRFPADTMTYFPEEESMITHYERLYGHLPLAEIGSDRFASLPILMDPPGASKVLFTEADLYDYPAVFMEGAEGTGLAARHPPVILEAVPADEGPDRHERIVREADYIARTDGTRSFPWRLLIISDRDGAFIENDLVFLLSRPLEIEDPSWIRPGRVAWDWYNAWNLTGVDFETGVNTATYRYYIDFAAEYGLEYIILDEGWSISTTDVSQPNPDLDLEGLIAYGKERGVDLILWALWGPLAKERETLFPLYEKWGVAGVKIDFMQRSDQEMVNFYTETAKLAAKHKLLLDFHGSFKPAGLRRAYPNVLSYEGVKGHENNKWSSDVTPGFNVTVPFIRMAAGPMDYTPGAMRNAHLINHNISFTRPMSVGTRAHEVAKYVIYESPLQMLCDTPTYYEREPLTTRFIARIPPIWHETRVLRSEVGEYLLVARRLGERWYVAAMTNEEPRELTVDWSFLGKGTYAVDVLADGPNAEKHAEDFARREMTVDAGTRTPIRLVGGGGWTAIAERR